MHEEILKEDKIAVCPICGGEFLVSPKHSIYCSERCLKSVSGNPNRRPKSKSKVKPCEGCGKLFQTNRYTPDQKYCSQECYYRSAMKTTKDEDVAPKEHMEPRRVVCTKCGTPFKTCRNTTLCPLCRELG